MSFRHSVDSSSSSDPNIEVPEQLDGKYSRKQQAYHWLFGGKNVHLADGSQVYVYKYDNVFKRLAADTIGWLTRPFGKNPFTTEAWKKFENIKSISVSDQTGKFSTWQKVVNVALGAKELPLPAEDHDTYLHFDLYFDDNESLVSESENQAKIYVRQYEGLGKRILANTIGFFCKDRLTSKTWKLTKQVFGDTLVRDVFSSKVEFRKYLRQPTHSRDGK